MREEMACGPIDWKCIQCQQHQSYTANVDLHCQGNDFWNSWYDSQASYLQNGNNISVYIRLLSSILFIYAKVLLKRLHRKYTSD
jgi:hypothetical protein